MIKKISLIGFASALLLVSCNKPKDNELPLGQYNYTKFVPAITEKFSASGATEYIYVAHDPHSQTSFWISPKQRVEQDPLNQELFIGRFMNDQISRAGAKDCFASNIKFGKYAGHTIKLSECHLSYFTRKDGKSGGTGLEAKYSIDTNPETTGHLCINDSEPEHDVFCSTNG